jgi:hypothetical protein
MIPTIAEILAGLASGQYTVEQADGWIDKHLQMAEELAGAEARDMFAASALQGLLANGWCSEAREMAPAVGNREVAIDAFRLADAMLKARDGKN